MNSNFSSYKKSESFKEPLREIKSYQKDFNTEIAFFAKSVSEHYSKKDGNLSTKLFIIVSGGTKRERQYFSLLINKSERFSKIRLFFISNKEEGITSLKLLETAKKIKEKIEDSEVDNEDLFFLLSDRDHFYPELCQIINKCKKEKFNLIVSNPCFELWLYYGYFNIPPDKNGFSYSSIKKISSEFKDYLSDKSKENGEGGADPRKAIFKIEIAIKNSELNYSVDENLIPKIYSTNMHELAKELIPLIKSEIEIINNENISRDNFHINNNTLLLFNKKG